MTVVSSPYHLLIDITPRHEVLSGLALIAISEALLISKPIRQGESLESSAFKREYFCATPTCYQPSHHLLAI